MTKFRFTSSLFILLLLVKIAWAQTATMTPPPTATPSATVDVWPDGKMPGHGAKEPEKETLIKAENVLRITNVSRPTLALFPAPKTSAPAPAMIVCPGGAYSLLAYNLEGTEVAAWLNAAGINALILKYRVPGNREGALQDIQRALRLVRAHAAEWNIDPKRLGVIGFSAGGNLAAKASTQFDERTYPALDAVDQQNCRPDFTVLVYPAYLEKEGKLAPDLNLKAKIPPTLIVHTEDDAKFVLGSKLYHAALDEAKVPHEFKLYATGGHGYGLRSVKDVRLWPQYALNWLHKIGIQGTLLISTSRAADDASTPLRLVIIGDSTVCDYPATHTNRGWGQFIEERFKPGTVKVTNLAKPGRSTKTFITEGWSAPIL